MFKKDSLLLFIAGGLFIFFTFIMVAKEAQVEWKAYQNDFIKNVSLAIGQEKAQLIETGIQQIYLPSIAKVDRCITCHLGYNIPGLENFMQPFTTHPNLPFMKKHSFNEFGCTLCHSGQGYATKTLDAHGKVPKWEEPLLDENLGKEYGLDEPKHLIEINCNKCHRQNENVEWMNYINLGKDLFKKLSCTSCHIVEGEGGTTGPDLTFEGDKNPETFDFSNISEGKKTVFNWHVQHFKNPIKVVKGSLMPNFGLSNKEVFALAMLVMSWRKEYLPANYIPKIIKMSERETKSVEKIENLKPEKAKQTTTTPVVPVSSKGKEIFVSKGCSACHTIGKGKLVGPDLKGVTTKRKVSWLKNWLKETDKMLQTDEIAKGLLKDFNNIPMPQQNLTSQEIEELIKYFETEK